MSSQKTLWDKFKSTADAGELRLSSCTKSNESNKLRPEDRPVHDWYRFVLSFPPHLVRECLVRFGIGQEDIVLDPFCGTGTTLVECKKLGISSAGVEANPMSWYASKVKINWDVAPQALINHSLAIASAANEKIESRGIRDNYNSIEKGEFLKGLKSLSPGCMKLIQKNSISPLPLHKSLVLLELIEEMKDNRFYDHERLAFVNALVSSVSNLRFGPEVGLGPIKLDVPVISTWLNKIRMMANDLEELGEIPSGKSEVHLGDSRDLASVLESNSVDAVITSPPYPNEKDYSRTTRLESVLLGFIRSKEDLRAIKQSMIRSNTRGVYKNDNDDKWVSDDAEIQQIAREIEDRRVSLGKTSGFERLYAKVVAQYFGGMSRHLELLREKLKPKAMLAYIVGDQASYLRVMVRTGKILAKIAKTLGYEVEGIDLFRTRISTATKEQLREEILVLRWPGR